MNLMPYSSYHFLINDHANLTQHVSFPTHRHSHNLDLVITFVMLTLLYLPLSFVCLFHLYTDHFPIICSLKITAPITKHLTRATRAINITDMSGHLVSLPILLQHSLILWIANNLTLSQLLNKHVPLKSKIIRIKPRNPY